MWRSRYTKPAFLIAVLLLLLIFIGIRGPAYVFDGSIKNDEREPVAKQTAILYFTGDIMLDRGVEYAIHKYGKGDFRFPFLNIKDLFQDADFIAGNLEGPISDKGGDLGKPYSFRMDPKGIGGLQYAGFNAVSQANNHIDDWGREAIIDSKRRLEAAGIVPLGVGTTPEAYAPKVFTIKGIRVAIVALADFQVLAAEDSRAGAAIALDENVIKAVDAARKESDIAIVFYHYGEEYETQPTARQRELAASAFAHGADIVVGAHPHVVGPLEEKDGKYVAYSLGNFIFDQNFSNETMRGAVLRAEIDKNGVKEAKLVPIKINNHYQPESVDEY